MTSKLDTRLTKLEARINPSPWPTYVLATTAGDAFSVIYPPSIAGPATPAELAELRQHGAHVQTMGGLSAVG